MTEDVEHPRFSRDGRLLSGTRAKPCIRATLRTKSCHVGLAQAASPAHPVTVDENRGVLVYGKGIGLGVDTRRAGSVAG